MTNNTLTELDPRGKAFEISLPPDPQAVCILDDGSRLTIPKLELLGSIAPKALLEFNEKLTESERKGMLTSWWYMGRPEQMLPAGEWAFWLYLAGRGAGKTRTGSETARELVKRGYKRMGFIAPTASDARDVMAEGESGVLACAHESDYTYDGRWMGKPVYEPSKRRITWENGALATLYSADEPERLRGPQHEFIWADELCAWRYPETWDLAMFGLRLGEPRAFISTTPKPKKLIMDLIKDPSCTTTRGTTYDNRSNLAAKFFDFVVKKYEGTRLGEQELMGALLEEAEGALWTRTLLDLTRVKKIPEFDNKGREFYFKRIVVGVDPATTAKAESDETGIVVAGLGSDDEGYLLADYSGKMSPGQWAKRSVRAFKKWKADSIVAEGNQGGDMVKHTIKGEDKSMHVQIVHASRGKVARAEPIAQRFESGDAHIVGTLPNLEDQMCVWEPLSGDKSPDRLDAAVWALTSCILGKGMTGSSVLDGAF